MLKRPSQKMQLVWRLIPLAFTLLLALLYVLLVRDITFEDILQYTPENRFLTLLMLLALYSIKSLSVIFPLLVIATSTGFLFPLIPALLINLAGYLIVVTLPYLVGKWSGTDFILFLAKKYPKISRIVSVGSKNEIFVSYLFRAVGVLPGDIVSMVFGATGFRYSSYLLGSFIGMFPGMIFGTLLGIFVGEPFPIRYMVLIGIFLLLSLISSIFCNKKFLKQK